MLNNFIFDRFFLLHPNILPCASVKTRCEFHQRCQIAEYVVTLTKIAEKMGKSTKVQYR